MSPPPPTLHLKYNVLVESVAECWNRLIIYQAKVPWGNHMDIQPDFNLIQSFTEKSHRFY